MKGAREYARLFETGQYGRLYLVSGSHARGKTFRVYILPANEEAKQNGPHNPPLNKDAVEVYGITGGQPGWTETYGWLHEGRWQEDFDLLVEQRRSEVAAREIANEEAQSDANNTETQRVASLLATY